jgi:TPR repeat protein
MACLGLGVAYERGIGVRRNIQIARSFLDKACRLGSQEGCRMSRKLR